MIDTEPIVDFSATVPLRVTDFDCFGQLKPSAALALFQEAATQQADLMGIGHADMERLGVFWAVIRTYYEVIAPPRLYTSVQVRTWPHSPSRFSFLRDYTMMTMEGEELLRGTSEWVLMDPETRSFVTLADVYQAPDNLIDEKNFERKPRKLKDFDAMGIEPVLITPPFCAADINGHVNNSVYADYPFDALEPKASRQIRSFQIDFRHEVHVGETLAIYNLLDAGALQSKGVNESGEIAFATRTEFEG